MARTEDGNVVLGYCTPTFLLLNVDNQEEELVKEFARRYSKFHDLGSALILNSSPWDGQIDLYGNKVGKFSIIFGKPIDEEEMKWHVIEARRLGMVERAFTAIRKFRSVTIRTNAKIKKIPHPKIIAYHRNGDWTGVKHYLKLRYDFAPVIFQIVEVSKLNFFLCNQPSDSGHFLFKRRDKVLYSITNYGISLVAPTFRDVCVQTATTTFA